MSPALNTLIDPSDPSVVDNPLLGKWQAFYDLTMERLQMKSIFDSTHAEGLVTCANMQVCWTNG
jgi:hypothetical protein